MSGRWEGSSFLLRVTSIKIVIDFKWLTMEMGSSGNLQPLIVLCPRVIGISNIPIVSKVKLRLLKHWLFIVPWSQHVLVPMQLQMQLSLNLIRVLVLIKWLWTWSWSFAWLKPRRLVGKLKWSSVMFEERKCAFQVYKHAANHMSLDQELKYLIISTAVRKRDL